MAKRAEGAEYVAAKKARVWESAEEAEREAMAAGEPVVVGGGGCSNGNGVAEIDEDLHSRQLAVYGRETTRLLFASIVLVSGLNGLGAETAKNLALAGAKSVTLHDGENLEMWDLSGNLFLSEEDIRKKGVVACVAKLQELNNADLISALTEELSNEHLSKFQAVVFTNLTLEKSVEFADYCSIQQPPISFIKAEVCGLFGSVFCDFGPEFTVIVVDGEDPQTGIIAYISNGNPAMVFFIDDDRLEFKDGDLVAAEYAAAMRKAGDAQARELLEHVRECLEKERCNTFEDCVAWATLKFEDYFSNHVKQLIFIFPEDTASSTGAPFWSAPKRFPHPVQFSAFDSSNIQFILAASILRAVSFGIPIPDWVKNMSDLVNAVSKVAVPEFEPKGGVKIETDEKATNLTSASVDDVAVTEDLLTKLEACAKKLPSGFQMKPIQFEKIWKQRNDLCVRQRSTLCLSAVHQEFKIRAEAALWAHAGAAGLRAVIPSTWDVH